MKQTLQQMQKESHDNSEKHPALPGISNPALPGISNNAALEHNTSEPLPSNGKPSDSNSYVETDV